MNSRQYCAGLLSLFGFASSLFGGETITVDNVTDLTNHLDRLNRLNAQAFDGSGYKGNRYDTIILKKGF